MQAMAQPITNSPSPPEVPPTSLKERLAMRIGTGYREQVIGKNRMQKVISRLSASCGLLSLSHVLRTHLPELATLVENFQAREVSVKLLRCVPVLLLLALSFLLACQKPNTPASSTDNSNQAATGGAAGTATGSKTEAKKPGAEPVVVPAGTHISVRLGETLSSKSSQAGQTFSAT